ncbi:MAG TPA: glycosyltransferase [Xanthobacteraceae bacterium]|nr:glycosyltransferase [Xanthobacteraceae bacterium]
MLSVVIATEDSERPLLTTLAALVPGAAAGTIREVIIADAGSRDQTQEVADVAGCRILVQPAAPSAARLKAGAAMARGPWLMFLEPGVVPDAVWITEVTRFIDAAERSGNAGGRAAVFRPGAVADAAWPALAEAFALLRATLGAAPRSEQGLIISKRDYDRLGGHRTDALDGTGELLRRLGRRRIVMLRCGAVKAAGET